MSVVFGVKRTLDNPVTEQELSDMAAHTMRWTKGEPILLRNGQVGMGQQTGVSEAANGSQRSLLADRHGNVVALDGRLDNGKELCELLSLDQSSVSSAEIVLSALERWNEATFSYFVGDWAIALWIRNTNTLCLGRDHAGTRTLYYKKQADAVFWSSYLETLVNRESSHSLNSVFAHRFLAHLPIEEATPYAGIHAVPAGHCVRFKEEQSHISRHWNLPRIARLELRDDREYEERFLFLFRRSVERRIQGNAEVLAQLSGGMDSTSIVCMADEIRRDSNPQRGLIDTVSYFDESEPSWDDHTYFKIVENSRGKVGYHIKIDGTRLSLSEPPNAYLFPGASGNSEQYEREFNSAINIERYGVILSGLGGDEFLGGVPYPYPELASYLLRGRLRQVLKSSLAWGLSRRRPVTEFLGGTASFVLSMATSHDITTEQLPGWITKRGIRLLAEDQKHRLHHSRLPLENYYLRLLAAVRETLPHQRPQAKMRLEYGYPMLDRDLLEFVVQIPRNQLLRPGERRSLMRRAFQGLIPSAILNRRRKAALVQGPLRAITSRGVEIESLFKDSLLESIGLIESRSLLACLSAVVSGKDISFYPGICRAIEMELWLRAMTSSGQLAI